MQPASRTHALERRGPTRVERTAHVAGRLLGRLDLLTQRIPPWAVLAPLVLGGWAVAGFVRRAAVHSGWVYYNGGDETWYYTSAWSLAHARIPYSAIGYGYSFALAPLARIAGPNMLAGLPYVIAFNVLVLGPIALLCVYGIAKQIAGRRFAYLTSMIWVLAPLLAIPYFDPRYHRRYVGETLPAALGFTALGDFPSMVLLLVASYFGLRAIACVGASDALVCGAAAGLAIAVKPANGTFLPALVIGFLVAKRPRALALAAAGLVPALVCLLVWKARGIGQVPLFHGDTQALALGPGHPPAGLSLDVHHYLRFNWHRLTQNIDGLREYTWSRRLIEWSLVGGAIALGRRSLAFTAFVTAWLASYVLLKGSTVANFNGGSFFRYLAPAFPAAFLLAMSIPLLVPIAGGRLAAAGDVDGWPRTPRARKAVLGVAAVMSIGPIAPLLAFPLQSGPTTIDFPDHSLLVPANTFGVRATVSGSAVSLAWPDQSVGGARVRYAILRMPTDGLVCPRPQGGAVSCTVPDEPIRQVHATRWIDHPPAGHWVYRVVASSSVPPPTGIGNAILVSRAAAVDVA